MSVNMNIKIEKCPFCGGKSKVYAYLGKYYAKCIKCKTYSAPYDTPEQAAAWNTRAYSVGVDLCKDRKTIKPPANVSYENMEEATEI